MFSSLVSGMPEPEKTDSPFYIWIYRSFHIIAASGTSYFQHKNLWLSEEQMKAVCLEMQLNGKADEADYEVNDFGQHRRITFRFWWD